MADDSGSVDPCRPSEAISPIPERAESVRTTSNESDARPGDDAETSTEVIFIAPLPPGNRSRP